MRNLRALSLATLLVVMAVAGCLGGDDPAPIRTVTASGGEVSDGYAYDGNGISAAGATLEGWVNAPEDVGSLNASFDYAGSSWSVQFDEFSGAEDFKEGGIVFDIREHGDTGVSSASVPSLFAEVAAWGSAQVLRDGQPAPDPTGQEGRWDAHLMLSSTTIRGDDGRITKADGSTPYDPASPGDARTIEDDRQAILVLTAPSGPDTARTATWTNDTVEVQGNNTGEVEVTAAPYSQATVNVTASGADLGGQGQAGVGEVTVRIVDSNNTVLTSDSGQIAPNAPYNNSFKLEDLEGPFTVRISGTGTFSATVNAKVAFDDHPFLVVVWDDYTMDEQSSPP